MPAIIKARDIKVGTQLAEHDGFLWEVVEIVSETQVTTTIRMCSDFSSFEKHWKMRKDGTPGGIQKMFWKGAELVTPTLDS